VIPTGCTFEASFSSAAAIKAVEIVALMDKDAVKLTIADGEIVASVASVDNGRGRVKIAGKATSKDQKMTSLEIGFHPKYLASSFEAATVGKDATITACFTDDGSPVIITGNRAKWLGVVMPKRVFGVVMPKRV
jgi:DNA polymerase III sliding clamp (beta) subunit (PCNA family)